MPEMTMVPANHHHQNLSKQNHHQYLYGHGGGGYGGCGANYTVAEDHHHQQQQQQTSFGLMSTTNQLQQGGYEYNIYSNNNNNINESDHLVEIDPMAEDESRTNSVNEAGSSSKEGAPEDNNETWLQLSIGGSTIHHHHQPAPDQSPSTTTSGLIELDLLSAAHLQDHHHHVIRRARSMQQMPAPMFHLPSSSSTSSSSRPPFNLYFQHPAGLPGMGVAGMGSPSSPSLLFPHQAPPHQQQELNNWAFRPSNNNIGMAAASSSTTSYFARPFHHQQYHYQQHDVNVNVNVNVAGPSLDFRVVDPPRRPHSGIWFMLQASQNQSKEPFLPQIPRSYLRIKDGRMTVRLIKKYLVNKLRLDNESEVEITCRGQELQPFLTLQHVRDNIWSLSDALTTLLPESSTVDHLMVLHYARATTTSAPSI